MNFQFFVEKLRENEFFQNFMKKYKDSYPCSVFFIIDKQGVDNKQHFDFYVPKSKEMYSIKLEAGGEAELVHMNENTIPEKINLDLNFDFNEIEKLIQEKMDKKKIKNKLQKLLFSLQKKNNKHFLVGTIFISMMAMIKVNIDLENMEILDFEKKSFFDIMKVKSVKNKKKKTK